MSENGYRKKMKLSGRVQGVGFRFHTCRVAENYDIGGYVKNLPDGDVEIVAEGERSEVEKFLDRAAEGPSSARVTGRKSWEEAPVGMGRSFDVRR